MSVAKTIKFLDNAGIIYRIVEHAPIHTVDEGLIVFPDAYPVKNLLLKEEKGDRCVFVVMKGNERLDTKFVATELGFKKLQFAKPVVLLEKLGVGPGSASLFSLLHVGSANVEVIIDKRLFVQPEVGFHPSNNTQTFLIKGADIKTFLSSLGREFHELDL